MTTLKMNAIKKDNLITELNEIFLNTKNLNKTDNNAIIRVMSIILNKVESE